MTTEETLPANRLVDELSSYLRRHAYQPVDWFPWGEEAFAHATAGDKPILLSIGYASNRWCSRMEHESFEDDRIAGFMNARFVCVKVDREERPDIDAHYMEALQAITGEAAYPVTIFLTPEGRPFYGGSYFPPEARDGLPAFSSVLNEVAVQWHKKRDETLARAQDLQQDIGRRLTEIPDPEPLTPALLQQAVFTVQSSFDEEHGGFGEPPKFAQASALEFMLRAASRGVGRAAKVAQLTLKNMARGGIYDQLGGGFHRYSVDAAWAVPHFEKTLYDNALLARLYTHAWQLYKEPLYQRIALDTLEYLQRDLADPGGPFYAGEGSDSEGLEGRFYTWTFEEMEQVSPGSAELLGATRTGNCAGVNVLSAGSDEPAGAAQAALMKRRSERRRPPRDEKVLTSWNGLAVAALAEAGAAFDRPDLVEAARRTAGWLLHRHRAPTGRLYHSFKDEQRKVNGMLEDYAYLADGLYTLWEVTFEPRWIDACDSLCRQILELFWDPDQGGLFTTGSDHEKIIPRRKDYLDQSTPSAAGVAAQLLHRMGIATGNEEYSQRAAELLKIAQPNIQGLFLDAGAMCSAIDSFLAKATEIVVMGNVTDSRTRQMRKQIWDRYLPNKVCAGGPPGIASPLLAGKVMVDDQPTAYVTQGEMHKPPITDPAEFAKSLKFWAPPTAGQVNRVTELISNALQRRHFFDNLQNPAWIEPLRQKGLFEVAPEPIVDYVEETVGSPPWPQSRYLARMAVFSPKEVTQVALSLFEGDNVQVHEDLADVALAVPAGLAQEFVPKAKEWLKSPYQLHTPEKLGKLVRHLAEGGEVNAAAELAAALLEVRTEEAPQALRALRVEPEPRARFRKYDYEQILANEFSALVSAAPLRALEVICDLLESALRHSFEAEGDQAPADLSYLWRPAIHPSDQNADKTLRDTLTSAVVEAVEQIARDQSSLVPQIVERLEARRWHIFRRIALHVLRVWPETGPELIKARLSDPEMFHDPHFHHEYLLLARDQFEELNAGRQAAIVGWIDEGPDLHRWMPDPHSPLPDDNSVEAAESYRKRWQLKRLLLLEDYLLEDARLRLAALTEELGHDEHPDFIALHPPKRPDPTTPLQADELHYSNLDEVLELLATWRPTPGLGNPTIEGLARKLAQVVATEPVQFARSARRFKGLHPMYIWAVLQGLREGSEAYTFDWVPVLDLCAWTVDNSMQAPAAWLPARLEVARTLSRGLTQGTFQMPYELRAGVWNILQPLTDDPDPVYDPTSFSSLSDAASQSAGTVRGEAMHAVCRYALWLRRNFESGPDARAKIQRGFDEMPEVREVLEHHLDPALDPSPAIKSVYGRWFAWLVMLDGRWAGERVAQIFPQDEASAPLRTAAWEALVSFSPAYDHLLGMINSEYERGVDLVSRFEQRAPDKVHPENRLAEHLMVFYLRGRLAMDDKGLLFRFFRDAADRLRRHALGFVGRSLSNQKGEVPLDFALKLRNLWERRIKAAEAAGSPEGFTEEMSAFGWWFASGKLDKGWSLRQLRRVLDLGIKVEAANLVVAKLTELVDSHPRSCIDCLALILTGEQDSVSLLSWSEDARTIINKAMSSGDAAARTTAVDLLRFFDVQELEELVRWE